MSTISYHRNYFCHNKFTSIGLIAVFLAGSFFGVSSSVFAKDGNSGNLFNVDQIDRTAIVENEMTSPFEEVDILRGSDGFAAKSIANMHGETSVEDFQGTKTNLRWTHESAKGFCEYLENWYPTNFRKKDNSVLKWFFHDTDPKNNYDLFVFDSKRGVPDWGIDAVRVAFHSSHGGMRNNVFLTSMGGEYRGEWQARSDNMALGGNYNSFGDERLRYMFWDTCNSVMVSEGNNPYQTWAPHAHGIRMIFGYATTSIDNRNYGKYFWQEWSKNKTFKKAFLDASWRISHKQSPALVAFGSSQNQAIGIRDNERTLFTSQVKNAWAAWSYYESSALQKDSIQKVLADASTPEVFDVDTSGNSDEEVVEIADKFDISIPDKSAIQILPENIAVVKTNAVTLSVEENGNYELSLNNQKIKTREESFLKQSRQAEKIADKKLLRRSNRIAKKLGLLTNQDIRVSMVRSLKENEGSRNQQLNPRVTEKTVILDQTIGGISFIDPEAGHLEMTFNARTGELIGLRSTLKTLHPRMNGSIKAAANIITIEQARQKALNEFNGVAGPSMKFGASAKAKMDSEAVGYQLIDGKAVPVYRVEITSAEDTGMSRPFQAIIPLVDMK